MKRLIAQLLLIAGLLTTYVQVQANPYVDASKAFLTGLRDGTPVDSFVSYYANLSVEELQSGLPERSDKLAFWINTYNAFVIYTLQKDPSKFDNRSKFFTGKQLQIAGHAFSLDNIEHDIIRNLRVKWGLGYIKKWFSPKHLRQLRVKKREPRVHFALNCGAISCPPVAIYDEARLDEQLKRGTQQYLESVTSVDGQKVLTTPLFSWFRGDFSGKRGVKKMLMDYKLTDSKKVNLAFGDYDWTLRIDNFTEL